MSSSPEPKILFVDDDRYDMLPHVEKLRSVGFEVTTAIEVEDAVALLARGLKPDLIIADLIMRTSFEEAVDSAHSAGVRFCKVVREGLRLRCPILVLSVLSEPAIQASVRPYAELVLNKPILPNQLVRYVREALS